MDSSGSATPDRPVGGGTAAPPHPVARAVLLGLAAGLLSGLFGVGGGLVLVPGLVWLLRLPQHEAHATSLAAIILTASAALGPFALDGSVSWSAGALLAGGSLGGAYGGAALMRRIPARSLRIAFAVLVLLAAIRLAAGDVIGEPGAGGAPNVSVTGMVVLAAVGLGTGALSAVLGVGGGVVLVPALVVGFAFPQHLAEGTSLFAIVPTAIMGAVRHADSGLTRWRVGWTVGAAGAVGGPAGAWLALSLPEVALRRAFAALLAVVAVRLLVRVGSES